jgi:V-type H+-transporting ATPase subunit F
MRYIFVDSKDTVTGFLLTGIGERNVKGETNYLVVDEKSRKEDVEAAFKRFLKESNISVILITQDASEKYVKSLIAER